MSTKHTLRLVVGAAACVVLAACSGGTDTPTPSSPTAPTSTAASSSSPDSPPTAASMSTTTTSLSRDHAGKIATDEYGGQVLSVEPDHAKGRATWEVELKNSRQGRIEVDIAKDNGDIVATEPDNDNG